MSEFSPQTHDDFVAEMAKLRAEAERLRDQLKHAVAEINRLHDNPVARRMKDQRDAALAEVDAIRDLVDDLEAEAVASAGAGTPTGKAKR